VFTANTTLLLWSIINASFKFHCKVLISDVTDFLNSCFNEFRNLHCDESNENIRKKYQMLF